MKLKLDLFDKRIVVYEAVKKALGSLRNFDISRSELRDSYLNGIAGARWLFNEKMEVYLSWDILDKIDDLRDTFEDQRDAVPASQTEALRARLEPLGEVKSLLEDIEERFAPFLSVSH